MLRFVGPDQGRKYGHVNGDLMLTLFQYDMSAASEKICNRFTDFLTLGSIFLNRPTCQSVKSRACVRSPFTCAFLFPDLWGINRPDKLQCVNKCLVGCGGY